MMIVFKAPVCQRVIQGKRCFICGFDYHCRDVKNYDLTSQFKSLKRIIEKNKIEHIDILSSGSILDSKQINYRQLLRLIEEIKKIKYLQSVLIEGRVDYCHLGKLRQIKQILNNNRLNKNIELEYGIGLESWSDYVRNRILKKDLKLKDYIRCLEKLRKINVGICTYVLIGVPKLSLGQSLREAKNSIIKIVDLYKKYNYKGRIAVFPIFITPNTSLEDLYNQGKYKLIALTDIMGILLELKDKIDFKNYPIFIGLDDEGVSQGRYVSPQNKKEERILKLIKKFNYTQQL